MVKGKRSRQKEIILQVLQNTKEHPDADKVYAEVRRHIPKISLATVYRNLSRMVDDGVIQRLDVDSETAHYDADISVHYHMVCKRCGRIDDIPAGDFTEYVKRVQQNYDGKIEEHSVVFYGLCKNCENENNQNNI